MRPFSLEEQHEMKPTREASSPSQEGMLQQLFALIERLREHPELIAVVNDFLHEVSDTAQWNRHSRLSVQAKTMNGRLSSWQRGKIYSQQRLIVYSKT